MFTRVCVRQLARFTVPSAASLQDVLQQVRARELFALDLLSARRSRYLPLHRLRPHFLSHSAQLVDHRLHRVFVVDSPDAAAKRHAGSPPQRRRHADGAAAAEATPPHAERPGRPAGVISLTDVISLALQAAP